MPGSALTNQVLLNHEFAITIERLGDVRVHDRVGNGDVARDADGTNVDSLELEKPLTALQAVDEAIFRQTRSRRGRQGIVERGVLSVLQLIERMLDRIANVGFI